MSSRPDSYRLNNQNHIPPHPASPFALPIRDPHADERPRFAIRDSETSSCNDQHGAHRDAPCMPSALQAIKRACEAGYNGGDPSFTQLHAFLRLGGRTLTHSDHLWMFNDILASVCIMSEPVLWALYLHDFQCGCMGISFGRQIGVATSVSPSSLLCHCSHSFTFELVHVCHCVYLRYGSLETARGR